MTMNISPNGLKILLLLGSVYVVFALWRNRRSFFAMAVGVLIAMAIAVLVEIVIGLIFGFGYAAAGVRGSHAVTRFYQNDFAWFLMNVLNIFCIWLMGFITGAIAGELELLHANFALAFWFGACALVNEPVLKYIPEPHRSELSSLAWLIGAFVLANLGGFCAGLGRRARKLRQAAAEEQRR